MQNFDETDNFQDTAPQDTLGEQPSPEVALQPELPEQPPQQTEAATATMAEETTAKSFEMNIPAGFNDSRKPDIMQDFKNDSRSIRDVLKSQMNFNSDSDEDKYKSTVITDTSITLGETRDKKYDEIVTVQPVTFASFENDELVVGPPRKNLDIMQDVHIRITVELGRTRMKVKKLLDITKGTIIEINKVAGEQAELFVCGKLVAIGEVIVIEDKFGLKITSIVETKVGE